MSIDKQVSGYLSYLQQGRLTKPNACFARSATTPHQVAQVFRQNHPRA